MKILSPFFKSSSLNLPNALKDIIEQDCGRNKIINTGNKAHLRNMIKQENPAEMMKIYGQDLRRYSSKNMLCQYLPTDTILSSLAIPQFEDDLYYGSLLSLEII